MAELSLYRRYRPQSFKEVMGQEHITGTLESQVEGKTFAHAYLFAGSRGLGKTSIARIFARELGADERDIREIDAASHNGVDHIRALSEEVYTMPFSSPYKVYILDEAHMLSKNAWNAFLKTLEEPPAHAVFILATTELEKVPETVKSRCQVFEFRKPSKGALAKLVASVAKKEGYQIETAAADLVAMLADGSYRDSLSVLERVLASASDRSITLSETEKVTGAPKRELVATLAAALGKGDAGEALATLRRASEGDVDMSLYLDLLLEYVRATLLVRYAPTLRKVIEEEQGGDAYAGILALAEDKDSKLTHDVLKALLEAASQMRYASVPALPLELAILGLFAGSREL
ncbi:MAG: DNA polymerase III subunit gamma/tau [Candidatus Pacebacteria bacterium]|nr:DNA polymerase III subunit gamma/tau [Candidatus Paceibacterota bacterium]MBP9840441.1 DNA polymerase III subunit gamma/tau [Candidatus Paceibacterota bacterium]